MDIALHVLPIIIYTIGIYMTLWFMVGFIYKRNDVADIAWGLGFIVASLVPFFIEIIGFDLSHNRSVLATLLVVLWGGRLAYHIFKRNKNKGEDARYVAWRNAWGNWFLIRSYLQIYILQGILLILVVSPVLFINTYKGGALTFLDLIGFAVWIIGFYFESTGDKQLKEFIQNPLNKGKILSTGLWKYTRHPNYFGEVTQWWGLWIVALSVPYGYIGIIGPLTITFLILKVSGIPLLEKHMAENPLFDTYRKTTSVFFPLPPNKLQ